MKIISDEDKYCKKQLKLEPITDKYYDLQDKFEPLGYGDLRVINKDGLTVARKSKVGEGMILLYQSLTRHPG